MSVARHLHTPQPRTEVDVAADAIVAILDARIVPFTPGMIGRLSMATGVPVADIERAWQLKESGRRPSLPARRPVAEQPSNERAEQPAPVVVPSRKPQGVAAHRNATRTAAAYPTPDTRRCSKCEVVKAVDEFDWKDRKKGYRRSWCRDCWNAYQRERWLSVEQTRRLGILLRFVVCEEDHLETDCITCHLPIEAGQEVVADDVKLFHASCSAD
jgi:hypothetical protein